MKPITDILSRFILVGRVAVSLLSGCAPVQRPRVIGPIATPQTFIVRTAGYSVHKRPIDIYIAGSGSETILILSTIHGNEQAGVALSRKLMDRLRQRQELLEKYRLLIIPVANPDGVAQNSRYNANGIDLNRNFPAANRQNSETFGHFPLSEPETRVLYNLINDYRPVRIISIHQPLKCIDYDGPAEPLARRMVMYCDLPVKKLGAQPGSFGAYVGQTLAIPIITMELERADDRLTADQLWQRYGLALMAAITYPEHPY
ncbi:MAG: murein peptide amidase A [Planctomycetes bacterium]|jgi:protein MpaA|nr:murein peptide amidase A [Planctomycetota bacterium]